MADGVSFWGKLFGRAEPQSGVSAKIAAYRAAQQTAALALSETDRDRLSEIEDFLREHPRHVAVAVAARTALRSLVWVGERPNLLTACLGAAGAAWVAAFREDDEQLAQACAAAAKHADDAAAASKFVDASPDVAADVAAAAAYSVDAETDAAALAAYASGRAAAFSEAPDAWPGDRALILSGLSARQIAVAPLWLDGKTPDIVDGAWRRLKERLLARDEAWEAWTEWYEARLKGEPVDPVAERARALAVLEDDWRAPRRDANVKLMAFSGARG